MKRRPDGALQCAIAMTDFHPGVILLPLGIPVLLFDHGSVAGYFGKCPDFIQ